MKQQHVIFYGVKGDAAKARASKIRADGGNAQIRQAVAYQGEVEPFDAVEIQSDVTPFDRVRIEKAYGDKVTGKAPVVDAPAEKPRLTLPPAPPVAAKVK